MSVRDHKQAISGRFSLMAVTTLEKLLLSGELVGQRRGALKLIAVEEKPGSVLQAFFAALAGKLGRSAVRGVHFEETDEITIEGVGSNLILDGETFRAELGRPIDLRPAMPLSFVKLAAWTMPAVRELVAEELALPVDPRVSEFAEAIAAHGAHPGGSVLRLVPAPEQLDGLMLDFYLIVRTIARPMPSAGWPRRTR